MEREIINADVLFIGAGPACLAGAIQLMNLLEDQQEEENLYGELPKVIVLEKGSEVGAHIVSGAVIETKALEKLKKAILDISQQDKEFFI